MLEEIEELDAVELGGVEAAVGSTSFGRGRTYARGKRVVRLEWDPDVDTLLGTVVGHGALYETAAYFEAGDRGRLAFTEGDCTCPIGYNCKHVAAIVVAATDSRSHRRPGLAGPRTSGTLSARARSDRVSSQPATPPELGPEAPLHPALAAPSPSWEAPLRALIGAPAARTTGAPLAIELSLQAAGGSTAGAPRLLARLMRPGARGGWINGSLSWNALDSWQVRDATLRADHLGLVRELHAIHRAREGRAYYSYGYGSDRTIELGVCESPQLWSLLDDAERLGLELIHARAELGPVRRHRGEVVLDVTRDGDLRSLVRAVARIDDRDDRGLEPQLFVGSAGHGLVCVQAGDADMASWRLHLVALERPVPAQLQRMVLDSEALSIPTGELEGFAAEIWPALRHVAPVISSDGSFSPPEISAPELVLRASYGDGHLAQLGWEWAYQVGDETRRAPLALNGDGPGFRDPAAERARLDAAALGDTTLADLGLLDLDGRPAARTPVLLAGLEVARLTSEQLPALTELPGVTVEIGGEPADYRDVDDALEIGVSATAEGAGARDWFDLGVTITVEGRELPFADVFVALAGGEPRMLLDDGAHFSLQAPRLQALRRLIEEARALTDSPSGPLRLSRYQAGLWQELVALGVVTEQAQEWQRAVQALVSLGEIEQREPPAGLCARLRPYQCEGFGWLALLLELELGGILADDMGLGKTVQTLAMICHARDRQPDAGPFLVVAPTSVVPGWVGETARFAPRLRIEAVTDTLARSGRQIAEIADADIVVTTYTLLRLEAETYRGVAWAGVILDEAQAVKNHQTKTHRAVRELRAPFKLAVTGTPMENNLMELWALLSITAPGLFPDPKRFSEHYARPIERARDGERLERLRRRIRPLVKRRTKELVATDLPPKQEQTLTVDLHPRHRKLYDTHLQRERQRILGLIGDFDKNRFTILRSITLLRQLSLHPGLVDSGHDNVPCAKLAALAEHLEEVAGGGHRALVFSQFTGFLAKVRERLDHDGVEYCYLDGSTRRRDLVLERFRSESVPVFLISLKAGGFGLNLTEADYCFLLDPWWNPAAETQAIDRTHRIGQTRPVMVYRTISRDTIEEKVVALAQRKAALFRGVMDDGDLFAGSLTVDDIRGLVS